MPCGSVSAPACEPDTVQPSPAEAEWSWRLYAVLRDSTVGRTLVDLVTPLMHLAFGWLTPQVVRDTMG